MEPDVTTFVIVLDDIERAYIMDTPVNGQGGFQTFQRSLQAQLENSRTINLSDAGFGQLIRYSTRYGAGGAQDRLRRAFARYFRGLIERLPQVVQADLAL
jgi:hypothetical protein